MRKFVSAIIWAILSLSVAAYVRAGVGIGSPLFSYTHASYGLLVQSRISFLFRKHARRVLG